MNDLKAGFARTVITPPMGIELSGYFFTRLADGVLDDLEINALAVEAGGKTAVLLSFDLCSVVTPTAKVIRALIAEKTGLPEEAVFLAATHSHTAPPSGLDGSDLQQRYGQLLCTQALAAATAALSDRKPARMGWRVARAPEGVAFVRRYRMKNGGVQTNPPAGDPDIVGPIGEMDDRVNVLRFDREGGDTLVLVNFGNHPDTIGGCKVSADWPGVLRRTVEKTLDGTKCIFFNGAEGDVNHLNVHARGGDWNDLEQQFDCVRGLGHTKFMGRAMAGAVLQVYDKVNYVDVDRVAWLQRIADIPANVPSPDEMPLARKYDELHKAGRDDQIPFEGMELTTVVAEAARMVRLEHGPESFPLVLEALAIGPAALFGIAGEPFTGIGRALKEAPGWSMVLPCCNANGREGYFPMQEAYDEGGYEARSSAFRAGVAERIIAEGLAMLEELKG